MLGVHAQVTFILATNTNIISKIFYFKQSSPGSANCMFSSQTGHSVIPKHFCFDQVHFLCQWLSLKIIVSMIRNSILDPQIISKNGKQQEKKKQKTPKPRDCTFLMETPCLHSYLDTSLNSLSVYLLCDIEFITFWFVIQDMCSYMQKWWNFITLQMLLLL